MVSLRDDPERGRYRKRPAASVATCPSERVDDPGRAAVAEMSSTASLIGAPTSSTSVPTIARVRPNESVAAFRCRDDRVSNQASKRANRLACDPFAAPGLRTVTVTGVEWVRLPE